MERNYAPSIDNKTFCLLENGWSPIPFAIKKARILLDRNAATEIKSRFEDGKIKNGKDDDSIACLVCDSSHLFSCIHYGFESNTGDFLTVEEIRTEIIKLRNKIETIFKKVPFVYDLEHEIKLIESLIKEQREYTQKRTSFLINSMEYISKNTPYNRRREVWEKICLEATKAGLPKSDIIVLCALGASTAPQCFNIGKKIIKPSKNYSRKDAFNAVCDMALFELLFNFHKYTDENIVVFTKDKYLAIFYSIIYKIKVKRESSECLLIDGTIPKYFFIEDRVDTQERDQKDLIFLNNVLKN